LVALGIKIIRSMRFLRILLWILLVFAGILVILGLVGPKTFDVSRTAFIPAPASQVWPHVSSLKATQAWSPWSKRDPNMTLEFKGEDGQVGASYAWSGNDQVGKGEQTVTKLEPTSLVETELKFFMPWGEDIATSYTMLRDTTGGTNVQWGIRGENGFIGRIFGVFMNFDEMMGKDFEEGLGYLQEVVASAAPAFTIQPGEYPGGQFLGARAMVNMADMQQFYGDNLGKAFEALKAANLQMTGMPHGLYYSWDMEKGESDMAAAIPFTGTLKKVPDGMSVIDVPAARSLTIEYMGGYGGMAGPHNAMDAYIQENGLTQLTPVMEEYVTDPGTEPDSMKWVTKIIYLVK